MTNTLRMVLGPTSEGRITASASANVSGGYLLKSTGGTDIVNASGASSFAFADLKAERTDSSLNCIGIALGDAASGGAVAVGFNGVYILQAGSVAVSGGLPVVPSGYEDMVQLSVTMGSVAPIGRALTTATLLTGYALVKLNI